MKSLPASGEHQFLCPNDWKPGLRRKKRFVHITKLKHDPMWLMRIEAIDGRNPA